MKIAVVAANGRVAQKVVKKTADYAIAMVDEIEKGNHIQQRISIVRE